MTIFDVLDIKLSEYVTPETTLKLKGEVVSLPDLEEALKEFKNNGVEVDYFYNSVPNSNNYSTLEVFEL